MKSSGHQYKLNVKEDQKCESMFQLIELFLDYCVERKRIPMNFVASESFQNLALTNRITKNGAYEKMYYSRDSELHISRTRKGARYYVERESIFGESKRDTSETILKACGNFDLSLGFDEFKMLNRNNSTLENVRGTKYVALESLEKKNHSKLAFSIILSRHTLKDLLLSPFSKSVFKHNIVYFDGQIFMEAEKHCETKCSKESMTGYNFESLMTCNDLSESKLHWSFKPPRDNSVKYNTLVLHEFSDATSVLVSCEIDAVQGPFPNTMERQPTSESKILERYIELKCRKVGKAGNTKADSIQCYLSSTPNLIVGFRSLGCSLAYIKKYRTLELLNLSTNRCNYKFLDTWFWFCSAFLRRTVSSSSHAKLTCYRLAYDKVTNSIQIHRIRLNDDRIDKTLLQNFIRWRKRLRYAYNTEHAQPKALVNRIQESTTDPIADVTYETKESTNHERKNKIDGKNKIDEHHTFRSEEAGSVTQRGKRKRQRLRRSKHRQNQTPPKSSSQYNQEPTSSYASLVDKTENLNINK